MLEIISNEQRKYFGLEEINPDWKELKVESENFNGFEVLIYVDNTTVKKCIVYSPSKYKEIQMNIELTKDLDAIIVTDSDKKISSLDSIINKTGSGVTLSFDAPNITIYNENTKKVFYKNFYEQKENLNTIIDFKFWAEKWCEESTEQDLADISSFASKSAPLNIEFNEGDIFKVKLSRRIYGYGRVLLSYSKMKENNENYWDCLLGTPVIANLYHILTEDDKVSANSLNGLKTFPSQIITEENLVCGDYEIIGNIAIDPENEDYPIMYGKTVTDKETHLQHGKKHLTTKEAPIFNNFRYNGISNNLGINLEVMKQCVAENSNEKYYSNGPFFVKGDLRNPVNAEKLDAVLSQFGLK